jgi:hypothetical protein
MRRGGDHRTVEGVYVEKENPMAQAWKTSARESTMCWNPLRHESADARALLTAM